MKTSFHHKEVRFSMGPFLKCPHPEMVESCGLAGFDFAIADMEHTPISPRELLPLQLAAKVRGIELIVRIPENSASHFKWCLDLGITHIQVPHIQSKADVENALKYSRFAPLGDRGLCRFVRSADYSAKSVDQYMKDANPRLILQIEGEQGLRSIDDILSCDGIDWIFIGPYDLSQSLGYPGQIWHPKVTAAMTEIIEKCSKFSVRVGTFADSSEGIFHWVGRGVQMIQFASDLNLFLSGAKALHAQIGHS